MRLFLCAALIAATSATAAQAQSLNNNVPDFQSSMFQNCTTGTNIGDVTKVSNPMLLLGSLLYFGTQTDLTGATSTGLIREPLALPIISSDATSPDQVTCNFAFEATGSTSLSIPGLSISAERGDVYKGSVRLVLRQNIATVPESGYNVQAWKSAKYREMFRSAIAFTPSTISEFKLVDNISVYIITAERYKRDNAGIAGAIGILGTSLKYKRDESFAGTKVIVTGDVVTLLRNNYTSPNPPTPPPTVSADQNTVAQPQVIRSIAPGQLQSESQSFR
jgi:hypothetical protein